MNSFREAQGLQLSSGPAQSLQRSPESPATTREAQSLRAIDSQVSTRGTEYGDPHQSPVKRVRVWHYSLGAYPAHPNSGDGFNGLGLRIGAAS